MKKMFGFSRRRMKLGRLRVHLGDPSQGTKSPARPTKRPNQSNGDNVVLVSSTDRSDDLNCQCSSGAFELNKSGLGNPENWMVLPTSGSNPTPRFHHAAAVVGSKMVVVGGETGRGMLCDTMLLSLDKLTWSIAAPKVSVSPSMQSVKIPACKGHCLVSWGKTMLLIGGRTDPVCDRVSVWSFDVEAECWSHVEAKGDTPGARSGHTVIRAGPVLILFGGEDAKGRKLNDLHMFDLKSLTWLPLHYTGTGPSPRANHVSTLYDDRYLLVFGGQSKSRVLNDLYSLDFETMVWSRIKIRGHHPSRRAGCCGALSGSKWYIVGGGSKKIRHLETLVFDVVKFECSVSVTSPNASVTTNKGFSLVPVNYQDKVFIIAFGGNRKEASNQVEILMMAETEHSMSWRSAPDIDPLLFDDCVESTRELDAHLQNCEPPHFADSVSKHSPLTAVDHHNSGRKSLSDSFVDPKSIPGSVSLRKQFHHVEEYGLSHKPQKILEHVKYKEGDFPVQINHASQVMEQRRKLQVDIAGILASPEEAPLKYDSESSIPYQKQGDRNLSSLDDRIINPSNMYQLYETKIAALTRRNADLEGQLAASSEEREAIEKDLSIAVKGKEDSERKLADSLKEMDLLKDKLEGVELAQEESNSLSNLVHSDNVRLEHDVAFLKAVLDDTQKELHSTRGVLTGERARAFQLQVEVFHLKQRLQTLENRAPTPRKPYHI